MFPWKKKEAPKPGEKRTIKANNHLENAIHNYANNYIQTSKYTLLTFLPINLFEQFRRIANAYFLFLLILQLIPQISSLTYITTIIPLVAVLSLTALKDAIDDIQRHRSDSQVNNRKSFVLRDGKFVEELWHRVVVGDIIRMENNSFVAADLLLLSSSEPNSLCYIETAELDGETNLKVKQSLPETAEMGEDTNELNAFDAEITCEAPNNNLNKFEGIVKWKEETHSIDNDKIVLRGCVLRNTQWCYGLVVFAGKDTKLMQNSGKTTFKRTNIDRLMNRLILGIFVFLAVTCLVCTVACGIWEMQLGNNFQAYLPWESFVQDTDSETSGATVIALLVFWSYVIVLNTVVPISLYVSVEFIRIFQSLWINWDAKMYYDKNDTPAKSRTTTLNEELGQIEYIFSDKTGTLTQNIMTFNKCTINGIAYGNPTALDGNPVQTWDAAARVDFSENKWSEETFEFYDASLPDEIKNKNSDTHLFFRLLALCHTVMPEYKDDKLEYQAQSPDENALVSAARNFGFVFKSRTPNTVTIEVNGKEEVYELLCILDFNNVRKRMSVILKKDNKIMLYCKGADTLVYERLEKNNQDLHAKTQQHLNEFARDGLRTLVLAVKEISPELWKEWKRKYHEASTALEDRDDKLHQVYEEIETDMVLVGASAIEDKLQDGVPECIYNLAQAGIKIWVLTGDKQETAINIGYSCNLLTDEMDDMHIIDGETKEEVHQQLEEALSKMGGTSPVTSSNKQDVPVHLVSFSSSTTNVPNGRRGDDVTEETTGGYALIINGHSLIHALSKEMEVLLLETGCLCKAVICCRVTPLQKAQVVELIKDHKKTITLAIGDGANDVSMIKSAHIGIGISGQEGMQAVLASDFSLAQFRFLERLLLVHGRWSYLRMCKFMKYFFYKNFAFSLCHFWFSFFCGFSGQTVFDPYFVSFYNLFYTSLPVLAMAVFDQDVNDELSLKYPQLYAPGHLNLLFNKKVFLASVTEGIVTACLLFFIPYGCISDQFGRQAFGIVIASILVIVMTLRCALDTAFWTLINQVFLWGSIIYYFLFIYLFYLSVFEYEYQGMAGNVWSTPEFWFTVLLTTVIILIPVLAVKFYLCDTQPTLADRLRRKIKMKKTISKHKDLRGFSRSSLQRRSTRSLRSGYAFSHEEGFGDLITSGKMQRPDSVISNPN